MALLKQNCWPGELRLDFSLILCSSWGLWKNDTVRFDILYSVKEYRSHHRWNKIISYFHFIYKFQYWYTYYEISTYLHLGNTLYIIVLKRKCPYSSIPGLLKYSFMKRAFCPMQYSYSPFSKSEQIKNKTTQVLVWSTES